MPLGGKGPATIAVLIVETILAGLCVGGRYYIRAFIKTSAGSDDAVLIASWCFMLVFAILFIISSLYGFGQHVSDLDKDDISKATLVELCGQSVVSIAMGLSKTGVALFLTRIASVRWHRFVLWGWISAIMFLSILLAISVFAQCYPSRSLWDSDVKAQACPINLTHLAFVMCSFSAAMDFFLACCPYYVLKDINMKPKEKWTVIISLSLGIIAGVFGIVRTAGLGVLSSTSDYLYATADSVIYTSTELTLTLVCVSLPLFRPLIKRLASTHSSGGTYFEHDPSDSKLNTFSRNRTRKETTNPNRDEEYGMKTLTGATADVNADISEDWTSRASWRDNRSDKGIFADKFGITRKQEFNISYN